MKLKELSHAVSLTAPRKACLLLQRIEERKKKEKKKRRKSPRTMQHNNSGNNSKAYSERERDCENEREHEAIERLFILSQPRVPTESGIKIEPIVVNL